MKEIEKSGFDSMANFITEWVHRILHDVGVSEQWIVYVKIAILIAIATLIVYVLQWVVKNILIFILKKIVRLTNYSFFNYAIQNKLPHYLALIVPYSFIMSVIPIIFYGFAPLISLASKLASVYMVFMVISMIMAFIESLGDMLKEKPAFHHKPLKSYFQVIQIILFIFGLVATYSILTGKSATGFFAAMGAASAVLLLVFKDSILGFVGSIQISANNMVRIGDWITMNKYGADGEVEEINLTTVKVRNFDKTITTIPTYALISDSFQNWRGMQESGGRRFKRAIYIKHSDIHFLENDELKKYKSIKHLDKYITEKLTESNGFEKEINKQLFGTLTLITNNDLFIQYCTFYLKNHPKVKQSMSLMVRQLSPTITGLPIELYAFTKNTAASEYEMIVSEIMNHLISIVKYFDLEIFEESSGSDNYNVYIKENQAETKN